MKIRPSSLFGWIAGFSAKENQAVLKKIKVKIKDPSEYVPDQVSVRKILTYGIFILCASTAWLRGGTYASFLWLPFLIAVLLCIGLLFFRQRMRSEFVNRIRQDRIFYAGIALLALILIQLLNSGRWFRVDDLGSLEQVRVPPFWFPWSANAANSAEMVAWFFPAWVCVLLVRNVLEWRHFKLLLYLLIWNAGALALVGILQHIFDTRTVLGMWNAPHGRFFATFDYVNHAAAWFYLNGFLAIALLKNNFRHGKPIMQAGIWSAVLFFCCIAALLTLSRFGAFVALLLMLAALLDIKKRLMRRVSGMGRVYVWMAAGSFAMLGIVLFMGAGGGELAREVQEKALFGDSSVAGDLGGRIAKIPLAWGMFFDYPVFGSGGWGYRWLAELRVPADEWVRWMNMVKANLHCDPMQFLVEFGLLGAGILVWVLILLLTPIVKVWPFSTMRRWVAGGIIVIFFHSFFDLPFRCPAILYEWAVFLAGFLLIPDGSKEQSGKHKKGIETHK